MTEREALKLALEAWENGDGITLGEILKKALAQPEQEPVAWMKDIGNGKYVDMVKPVGGFYGMCIPLYTHPPQRQWVGLTDEEFIEVCQMGARGNYLVAFHRILAKLKEKNT